MTAINNLQSFFKEWISSGKSEKFGSKEWFKAYGYIILGSLIFSLGDVIFANAYQLAPGGTYGLSNVFNTIWPWKISYYAFCMDIPLLIIGSIILGPKFGIKTLVSTFAILFFVWGIESTWGYAPLIHAGELTAQFSNTLLEPGVDFIPDYFLNTVIAGLLYGLAIGLIFRSGATSGGSDIISMILNKYTKISLGTLVIIVDSLITLSTMALGKGIYLPLYSILLIVIEGIIIDLVVDGVKKHRTVLIVTNKPYEVGQIILNDVKRGATSFKATGMYEGKEREMIYTTVTKKEYIQLKEGLRLIDPEVFMSVVNNSEVLGRGFKSILK